MSIVETDKKNLILGVDIGNTNTVIGVIKDKKIIADWRITTNPHSTSDELVIKLKNLLELKDIQLSQIKAIVLSCVVPPLLFSWEQIAEKYLLANFFNITSKSPIGIKVVYKRPFEVGSDRLVNALAVFELYKKSAIVVDYGTATTFDCISSKGEYLGGVIAPGILSSSYALYEKTAKLPKVDLSVPIKNALSQDTPSAMRAGLILGFAYLTDGMVKKLKQEMKEDLVVVATGGLAKKVASYSKEIETVIPDLTLQGLAIAYERLKSI